MRHRFFLLSALVCWIPSAAIAQDAATENSAVPAGSILRWRGELELSDAQITRLMALSQAQTVALSRATAAYLRAEGDLIDASRGDDLVVRRAALEKRARLAIDAEIARLKNEKESRSVLSPRQSDILTSLSAQAASDGRALRVSLWQPLVTPAPLTRFAGAESDSAEVRLSVVPAHGDVYIAGVKRGSGRMVLVLPVGRHEVRFHALGCSEVLLPVTVVKGPPIVVPAQSLLCGKF